MKAIFENKELKIIGVETDTMRAYEPMFHTHGEVLFVIDGFVNVTIDGKKEQLGKDAMCLVFPYRIHSYEPSADAKVAFLLFTPESTGEFAEMLLLNIPANPFVTDAGEFLSVIRKVIDLSHADDPLKQKTCGAYLKVLIGEILLATELTANKNSDRQHTIQKVLSYCNEHFWEDIDVEDVCRNVFVSQRYVTKIFADKVGCSFREFINRLRISKAVKLLEDTNMKITDVMYECGFRNQSTFNRLFLDEMGITPREYRKIKTH